MICFTCCQTNSTLVKLFLGCKKFSLKNIAEKKISRFILLVKLLLNNIFLSFSFLYFSFYDTINFSFLLCLSELPLQKLFTTFAATVTSITTTVISHCVEKLFIVWALSLTLTRTITSSWFHLTYSAVVFAQNT